MKSIERRQKHIFTMKRKDFLSAEKIDRFLMQVQVWLILGGVVDSEEGLRILHNVAADRGS